MSIKRIAIAVLSLLMVSLAACQATIGFDIDQDYVYTTIEADEANATAAIEKVLSENLINPQADLRTGEIVVSGEKEVEATGTVETGSMTITMFIEDGYLIAQITNLDFANWNASPEELANMNEKLAFEMRQHAQMRNSRAELTEVTIQDSGMSFTWRTPRIK